MDGRFLLDTNIVIAALSSDSDVLSKVNDADLCFISATVLGEMLYGALNSGNAIANLQRLESIFSLVGFLHCDDKTARFYGEIKKMLRQKGKPIPDNDIWIAASAQQYNLTLVTRDSHFEEVDDLVKEYW